MSVKPTAAAAAAPASSTTRTASTRSPYRAVLVKDAESDSALHVPLPQADEESSQSTQRVAQQLSLASNSNEEQLLAQRVRAQLAQSNSAAAVAAPIRASNEQETNEVQSSSAFELQPATDGEDSDEAVREQIAKLQATLRRRHGEDPATTSAAAASSSQQSLRPSSARRRLYEREEDLFVRISSAARFYGLLLLCSLLELVCSVRSSEPLRQAMSLPHVRDASLLATDIVVATGEWALGTKLLRLLPFSAFLLSLLASEEVQARWDAIPSFPQTEVLPWTGGPLRPLFVLASLLPGSSLLLELEPLEEEVDASSGAPQVHDGPLAAALKGREYVAPPSQQQQAHSLVPKKRGRKTAAANAETLAPASYAAAASAPSSVCASPAEGPCSCPTLSALTAVQVQLSSQQQIVSLLQEERGEMRASLRRLEQLLLTGQTPAVQQQAADSSAASTASTTSAVGEALQQGWQHLAQSTHANSDSSSREATTAAAATGAAGAPAQL